MLSDEDEDEPEESAPHKKRRFGRNKSSLADAGRIVERCSRALLLGDHGAPQRRLHHGAYKATAPPCNGFVRRARALVQRPGLAVTL